MLLLTCTCKYTYLQVHSASDITTSNLLFLKKREILEAILVRFDSDASHILS